MRKNFNPSIAACVLHCHREAEEAHSSVCVKFNGKVKTREDVRIYIKKSPILETEEDLLQHLPAVWPDTVTSQPGADHDLQSSSATTDVSVPGLGVRPGRIPQPVVSPPLAPLTLHTRNENLSPGSLIHNRSDAQVFAGVLDFPLPTFDSFHPFLPQGMMGGGDVPPTQGPWDTTQSPPAPRREEYFYPFDTLPTSPGPNFAVSVSDTLRFDVFTGMNMYGSVTPMGFEYNRADAEDENGKQTEIKVSVMLGTKQDLRDSPLRFFLVQCCATSIWSGQNDTRRSDLALQTATTAFLQITMNHYTYFLMILNNMRVLLDSYGHKDIIQRILQRQHDSVVEADQRKRFVIEEAIGFMLDTFEWRSDKAHEHLPRVRGIFDTAKQTAGEKSPLAISASYNLAWVLLEAGENQEALMILSTHKARCETTYGLHQIQTITWLATLARAHRKVNEQLTAEALMEETVAVRVEKAFSKDHPLYWEIQFRRGLFLLNFADDGGSNDRTEECWDTSENLFRSTLNWRRHHLGTNNPKTGTAWQWLKYCLKRRGKTDDANGLGTWWQTQQ